ncbi:hypothetical protein DITRI_Ditri11bG0029200 [Diplodiscus trichospermus]
MGDPCRFFSRFFNVLEKTTGNIKSKITEVNEKQTRIRSPAALPDEIAREFSLAEIKAATNNFHQDLIIGKGGFGNIHFKDAMSSKLKESCSASCAQNLVSLIGFCDDNPEMILVYEYLTNGTLRDHLYGSGYDPLPWKQRLEICIGAARGLHYLHTGAKQAVIHRDIKTSNFLLDDKWVCKLSDFGLSKLRPRSKSKALEKIDSAVKGTIGYLDPEYYRGGGLTEKCDVYSFGVLLFEMLCARKVIDVRLMENQRNLVPWARRCIGAGTIYNIIDPYLKGKIAPECFKIYVDMAYSCTCLEGNTRPDTGEVEMMLERALELQEKADSKMLHLASGGKYIYEEESFFALVPEYCSRVGSSGVEGDTGITYSDQDSASFTEILSSDKE